MISSDFPQELLEARPATGNQVSAVESRTGIPAGEHDATLFRVASWCRGQLGLESVAIEKALEGFLPLLDGVDPANPYTVKDLKRIARSASKYPAGSSAEVPGATGITWGDPSMYVGPPKSWWLHAYIPKGELVTINGKGASGKSTFASYVAACVTAKGGKVLRIGSEEPFERYLVRAALGNGNPYHIANHNEPSTIKLPGGAEVLRRLIEEHGFDFIYFDSIMSHFPSNDDRNAAERARACLAPLADIAISTGCTILCTFHENKAGAFMGSTEMENVGRVRLSITKVDSKSVVSVEKTNFKEPNYRMMLRGQWQTITDPATGEVQLEENEDGELVPEVVFVVEGFDKVGRAEMDGNAHNDVVHYAAEELADSIRSYAATYPNLTQQEIANHFDVSQPTVSRALRPTRE